MQILPIHFSKRLSSAVAKLLLLGTYHCRVTGLYELKFVFLMNKIYLLSIKLIGVVLQHVST